MYLLVIKKRLVLTPLRLVSGLNVCGSFACYSHCIGIVPCYILICLCLKVLTDML
jgi:hypothetical protein